MAQLIIPTPLRKFTGGQGIFTASANDVNSLLNALTSQHPGIRQHLFDDGGDLRTFIRIYVGDDEIDALDGIATVLSESTQVSIIPAIAGGSKD
ncbi:MAG: MoaD/ThiS family protein [Flavobacteriales bacterium]